MLHFLDVGANIGNTFEWYLLKTNEFDNCKIWCFEPSPRHLDHLRVRCASIMTHNSDHSFKITVCAFGLSNFTGYSRIYETVDNYGDSLNETSTDRPVELMCGVVDAGKFIWEEILRKEPDSADRLVLKIDPEGSEVAIVDSILRWPAVVRSIDRIMIEFHAVTASESDRIRSELSAANVRVDDWTL